MHNPKHQYACARTNKTIYKRVTRACENRNASVYDTHTQAHTRSGEITQLFVEHGKRHRCLALRWARAHQSRADICLSAAFITCRRSQNASNLMFARGWVGMVRWGAGMGGGGVVGLRAGTQQWTQCTSDGGGWHGVSARQMPAASERVVERYILFYLDPEKGASACTRVGRQVLTMPATTLLGLGKITLSHTVGRAGRRPG